MSTTYIQNRFVEIFRGIPRFGHPDDFSLLFAQANSAAAAAAASSRRDYTLGTLFVGTFLFAFFFIWMLLLAIFMCCGPKKVGFLAGFRMKEPYGKKNFKTPGIVRTVFVFSCLVVIAGVALSTFVWGFNDLKTASDQGLDITQNFLEIAQQGRDIVTFSILNAANSIALRDTVVDELRAEVFCAADPDTSGQPISEGRNTLVQDLYALDDFSIDELRTLRISGFGKMASSGEDWEYYFNIFGVQQWQLLTYFVLFAAISLFFMIGTFFAAAGKPLKALACWNTWFLLPMFLILVTLAWSIVSFYGIGAVMNSDFCSGGEAPGSPDVTISKIIEANQNEYLKDIYNYWISESCNTATFPLPFLPEFQTNLEKAISSMSNLRELMVAATNLTAICGGKDFGAIYGYFTLLTDDYSAISTNITNTIELLECSNVNPMYKELVHDVACHDVPEASIWAFGSLLIVSFFSMVMITIRSSWLDVIKNEEVPSSFEIAYPQDLEGEKRRNSNLSSEVFNDSPKENNKSKNKYFREGDEDDEDINRELEMLEADDESENGRNRSYIG